MHWLASEADQRDKALVRRFNPLYWTVNFPRPMMAALVSTAPDALKVTAVFYRKGDLAGLIWESEDRFDHPLLAYETSRDYSGVRLSFRWKAQNLRALDLVDGPTLTIEGRDAQGLARTWYVRLWNYAVGDPEDAVVTLDFDDLAGGFLLPGEADPVHPHDIDRFFISLVAPDYAEGSDDPLAPPVIATLELSDIRVEGPNASLEIGDHFLRPHGLRLANGYDDCFNVNPARILRNAVQLGYREWIDHYLGMSHYFSLTWNAGEGRFVVDPSSPVNAAAAAWHEAFFAAARSFGFRVILSLSFELLNEHAPEAWKQRTHDGAPALTGWDPPSTLVAPTVGAAVDYLASVLIAFAAMQDAIGAPVMVQIGEPWWWHQWDPPHEPCFYDGTTTALYAAETGKPVPDAHLDIFETPTAAQEDYLLWLGEKLGIATLALRDAVKAAYPEAQATLLFYTPQVLNPAAPMMRTVNMPAAWAAPAFDFLQVEDYDHVIAGDWAAHGAGLRAVADALGYGPEDSHYFAGFVQDPGTPFVWANMERAASRARAEEYGEIFVWAYSQVIRDGFVHVDDEEEDMSGFHEVRFPDRIAYGSIGGPRFATTVIETASGHEQRNMEWSEARAEYDVGSGLAGEEDLALLLAFFRARKGRAYGFRFRDWSDYRSAPDNGAVTPLDQHLGVGDGATTAFQLVKSYASGPASHRRVIAKPVAGTVRVALDGVEQTGGWTVDATTGIVTFDTAPAEGVVVTAGFEFDVPVRFRDDSLRLSIETFAAGEAPSVGLVEIKL